MQIPWIHLGVEDEEGSRATAALVGIITTVSTGTPDKTGQC